MDVQPGSAALYGGNPPVGIVPDPLIINVCLSGNVATKSINPHLPVSSAEIIEDAAAVVEAGASMLHVHAYDQDGKPTWQPDVFGRIFEGIRRQCPDVVLVATTSGRLHQEFEKRAAVLALQGDAKPDMASLTPGSLNFPDQASLTPPAMVQALCQRMRERNILPELEIFDLGMLNYAYYLQRKGMLPSDCYVNLMLGSLGTVPGRLQDLTTLVAELPRNWTWAAAGIGRYQLPINTAAILMGGNVRVGLEDNPYYDYTKREPASNLNLVKRIVRLAGELGRSIATPAATRKRLRIGDPGNWEATQVIIRKMREEDMADVMALLERWNMAPVAVSSAVPSPERDRLEVANTFVAVLQGRLVGVASYLHRGGTSAETASLAVDPDHLGCGIGYRLQEARLAEMRAKGIRHVRTESDRPEVVYWYIRKFGYRITGQQPKKHAFGRLDADSWTILELDLATPSNTCQPQQGRWPNTSTP